MTKGKKIGLTFAQMLVGCCVGVLAGGISLFCVNFLGSANWWTHLNGFLAALLLLTSFLIVYAAGIAGTAEGVRQMGRFIPRKTSRRKIYEGTFLGICAAVAILTVTRSDWLGTLEEWGGLVKLLGTLIYFVLVLPIKIATGWIPAFFILLIAGPIGAVIGYNIAPEEIGDSAKQPVKHEIRESEA